MKPSDAIQALAYAGVGSGAGAIIAAIISARSSRGAARAQAADLLTEAAERVSRMNRILDKENKDLRRSINTITQAVDDFSEEKITLEALVSACDKVRFGS